MKALQFDKRVRLLRPNFALHVLYGIDEGIENWMITTTQDNPHVKLTVTDSVDVATSARTSHEGAGVIILISNQPETVMDGITVVDANAESLAAATWRELMRHYP